MTDDVELLKDKSGFLGIWKTVRKEADIPNNRGKKYFGLQLSIFLIGLGFLGLEVVTVWQFISLLLISILLALYFSIHKFKAVKS